MAEAKTRPTTASVADFIASQPDEQRRRDCQTLARLMGQATGVKPVMWGSSIVGFGAYRQAYANGSSSEWPVIGFSPRKAELAVYLMPGFEHQRALLDKLGRHKTGKVCLYLKRLADADPGVLTALIEQSVKAMADRRVS